MTYETETTKTMTNRELAEAIVDDRIERGQFSEDDRDWLVEREMRETRESLVNGFNAIERWDDTDTDDDLCEIEDDDREPVTDTDLSALLGDFEWQYDTDAVLDMLTIVTPSGQLWLRDDEMPDWEEIDNACMWAPGMPTSVEHILEWHNTHSEEILDVDVEKALAALTDEVDGELVWKPLTGNQVDDIIYDLALVTSDNMGTLRAEDFDEDHIDEMWEVLSWADVTPLWIDPDMEEHMLGEIWFALTTDHYSCPVWKPITRSQVAEIVDDVLG